MHPFFRIFLWTFVTGTVMTAAAASHAQTAVQPPPLVSIPSDLLPGEIFFYRQYGQWAVLCRKDLAEERVLCELVFPPPAMGSALSPITISEPAADDFRITLDIRQNDVPDQPVFLRVDDYPLHEAVPARHRIVWQGNEARAILGEMSHGQLLLVRIQTLPDGLPYDMRIPLTRFAQALAAYRGQIRLLKLIAPRQRQDPGS